MDTQGMKEPRAEAAGNPPGRFRGMVVSDLDGTLLRRDHSVSAADLETLVGLGKEPFLRAVATGRSLYSARKVLPDEFPIEYLIFSSGAGIMDWRTKSLVRKDTLAPDEVARAMSALKELSADFMVHRPVPDNHYFVSYHSGRENPDFVKRCEIYREFWESADYGDPFRGEACEVLAVVPPGEVACSEVFQGYPLHRRLEKSLAPLKIIRATSPIDGLSTWVEIFPAGVSKGNAAEWIALREGLGRANALALGNDYNDLDLLEWASGRYVVANAPESLKKRYPSVGHHEESAFTDAVAKWRSTRMPS
jgi:hydroxymethylpyrimidine pyrophosphatase-like HAD family hydrolase